MLLFPRVRELDVCYKEEMLPVKMGIVDFQAGRAFAAVPYDGGATAGGGE